MKYLSNIYDPKRPDAKSHVIGLLNRTNAEAWAARRRWLFGKSIGRPGATEHYTVEELEVLGMVGVYLPLTE